MSDEVANPAIPDSCPTYQKVCEVCGVSFTTHVSWQKYHARVCRDIAHLRNKRKVREDEYQEFLRWKNSQQAKA